MSETSWVLDLLEEWKRLPTPPGREDVFYEVLQRIPAGELAPDRSVLADQTPRSPEAAQLLRLWEAWTAFVEGNRLWGWTILKEISRSLFYLPEPHLLVGAAALLNDDRREAIGAFRRGVRVDPNYLIFYDALQRFGIRRPPVLPFLHRNHPVNSILGRIRARFDRNTSSTGAVTAVPRPDLGVDT